MDDMDVSDAHFPVVVLFVELLTCYRSDCHNVRGMFGGVGSCLVEKLELEKLGVSKHRSMDGTDEDNQEDPNNGVSM